MPQILVPYQNRVRFDPDQDPSDAVEALQHLGEVDPLSAQNQGALTHQRMQRLAEMKRNLELSLRYPHQIVSGATPSDIEGVEEDLHRNPLTGDAAKANTAGLYQKAQEANLAGFESPQEESRAGQATALAKVFMPLQVERAKVEGQLQLDRQRTQQLLGLFGRPGQTGSIGGPQTPPGSNAGPQIPPGTAPAAPGAANAAPTGPKASPSWWSLLSGQGAPPYTSAKDWAEARSERGKYDLGFPTPYAPLAQETSFGNLQQVQAMFPGIRGVQHLLDKFHEHQANWGHETPAATLQRLDGMLGMLDQTEESLNDPMLHFKTGPNGQLELATTPQAIQRAKTLINDTRQKFHDARNLLIQQKPGIRESLQQAVGTLASPATTDTRFERLPE